MDFCIILTDYSTKDSRNTKLIGSILYVTEAQFKRLVSLPILFTRLNTLSIAYFFTSRFHSNYSHILSTFSNYFTATYSHHFTKHIYTIPLPLFPLFRQHRSLSPSISSLPVLKSSFQAYLPPPHTRQMTSFSPIQPMQLTKMFTKEKEAYQ